MGAQGTWPSPSPSSRSSTQTPDKPTHTQLTTRKQDKRTSTYLHVILSNLCKKNCMFYNNFIRIFLTLGCAFFMLHLPFVFYSLNRLCIFRFLRFLQFMYFEM